MAFIPLPNTIKLVITYTIGGKLAVNVLFFRKPTSIVDGDLEDVADVADAWDASFQEPLRSTASELVSFTTTNESSSSGGAFIKTLQPPRPGGRMGTILPNNVAGVISTRTGLRGRSFRGRTYLAGITENDVVLDEFTPEFIEEVLDVYEELQSAMTTAGFTWVVASRYTNNAPRVTGILTPVTELRMNERVDTQRRRLD